MLRITVRLEFVDQAIGRRIVFGPRFAASLLAHLPGQELTCRAKGGQFSHRTFELMLAFA